MSFLNEWGGNFESSSTATPQWNSFYRKSCNFIKKELKDIADNIQMSKGHFYFSGFFTAKETGKIFYFSISDVRYFPGHDMLIRTAKHYKDYTGGSNGYVHVNKDLGKSIKAFI